MLGIIFFFSLVVILPYTVYFKKQYKLSSDKHLFLKDNLYRSTIWIILLVVVPFFFVNIVLEDQKGIDTVNSTSNDSLISTPDSLQNSDLNLISETFDYINASIVNKKTINEDSIRFLRNKILNKALGHPEIQNLSLAYLHYKLQSSDSVAHYLHKQVNTELPYYNFLFAKHFLQTEKDSLAMKYLVKEIALNHTSRENAILLADSLLQKRSSFDDLALIVTLKNYPDFTDFQLSRKIAFNNNEFAFYSSLVITWFQQYIQPIETLAAALILLTWVFFLVKLSFFQRPKWLVSLAVFISGCLFTFLVFPIGDYQKYELGLWADLMTGISQWDLLLYSVFGIGAVEEIVKIVPLLMLLILTKKALHPFEYIFYASLAALGFAFVENISYFSSNEPGTIIQGRALTASLGHMIDSSIFAYGLVIAKYKYKRFIDLGT